MARYTGAVCRLCRREGMKLFLKGDKCYTDKCPVERRNYAPGQHGQQRRKFSEYGARLREKQKVKRIYGLMERQLKGYFERADRMKGITGESLLVLLERRLDNMVYRLGFAASRAEARQLVRHGHILVNGRKASTPSHITARGDVIELKEKSRRITRVNECLDAGVKRGIPGWLELDRPNYRGVVKAMPARQELTLPIQEQLIVEHYSR